MAGGQATLQAVSSASRPISRGGRSTDAGTAPREGRAPASVPELSMVSSSAKVGAEGRAPTSCLSTCSQWSKASIAAARSPRR
jgi:hypothetical protein